MSFGGPGIPTFFFLHGGASTTSMETLTDLKLSTARKGVLLIPGVAILPGGKRIMEVEGG